jgi:hypothetical protein
LWPIPGRVIWKNPGSSSSRDDVHATSTCPARLRLPSRATALRRSSSVCLDCHREKHPCGARAHPDNDDSPWSHRPRKARAWVSPRWMPSGLSAKAVVVAQTIHQTGIATGDGTMTLHGLTGYRWTRLYTKQSSDCAWAYVPGPRPSRDLRRCAVGNALNVCC